MSEDVKKNLRTQGKYSDRNSSDKRLKVISVEKKFLVSTNLLSTKDSGESQSQNSSWTDISDEDSIVKYEENSDYSFEKLEQKKPMELKIDGFSTISSTYNGESSVLYERTFIELDEGNDLYNQLETEIPWDERKIIIRGEEYSQPRLVAWYGPFPYTYSGLTLSAAEMPECIKSLKQRIEEYLELNRVKVTFNSVLLNYYRDNHDSVAWHSDDELTMGICPTIASISLGETRKFEMRRKIESYDEDISPEDVEKLYVNLEHGSLLVMNGVMQSDWQHRVPKEYHDRDGRINLTFRTVYSLEESATGSVSKTNKSKIAVNNPSEKLNVKASFKAEDFPALGDPINANKKISQSQMSDYINTAENDKPVNFVKFNSDKHSDTSVPTSSSHPNNSKDDIQIKHSFKKNVGANDSFASDSTDDSIDKNAESSSSGPTKSFKFENKMYSDKIPTNLNVEALEFVPVNSPVSHSLNKEYYSSMDFHELIAEDFDMFDLQIFNSYTDALKDKVLKSIHEFSHSRKEELYFLAEVIERTTCPIAQKLCRNRMVIVARQGNDKPNYSRNRFHSGSREEPHTTQKEFNTSNQRKRFSYGESRNRGENHFRGERSPKDNNSNQRQRNSYGESRNQGENYSRSNRFSDSYKSTETKNEKDNSQSEEKQQSSADGWDLDPNDSHSKSEGIWDDDDSNKKSSSKVQSGWDDDNSKKDDRWTSNTKSQSTWEDDSSKKDGKWASNTKSQSVWEDGSSKKDDRWTSNIKSQSTWEDDNSNRSETSHEVHSSWNDSFSSKRDFNKGERRPYPSREKENSNRERDFNRDERYSDRGSRFSNRGANSYRGNRNFNRDEEHSNRVDRSFGRGFGKNRNFGNSRNNDDQSNEGGFSRTGTEYSRNENSNRGSSFSSRGNRGNRRGFTNQPPPRFSRTSDSNISRNDEYQNKQEDSNKDDFSPIW